MQFAQADLDRSYLLLVKFLLAKEPFYFIPQSVVGPNRFYGFITVLLLAWYH